METQVNKSEQNQFQLNFIAIVSLLTFAGILFFVSGKTLFDNPVPTKDHFNGMEHKTVPFVTEKEQPKEARINPAEFDYLKTTEISLMVFPVQNLEERKLNVLMAANDWYINELILTDAAIKSVGNPAETDNLFSGKNCNLGWKTAKGSECFFCRCNEYLARMAERKNQGILYEIDLKWQMNNFLALETEEPMNLESWMTDEKCWCPEQRFDFNNFELLAKASEK